MNASLKVSQIVCVVVYWLIRVQGMVRLDFAAGSVVFRACVYEWGGI